MKKQKKTMVVLLVFVVLALLGYFALNSYSKKTEEKIATEEEEEKIYLSQVALEDIASFSYQADGEYLTFSKIEDKWVCSEYQDKKLDEDKVDNIADVFSDVRATCIIDDPMELSEYGLDNPSMNISVTSVEGKTITFALGNVNDITNDYYLLCGEDDKVYMVASSFASNFKSSIDELTKTEEEEDTSEEVPEETTEESAE